MTRSAYPAVLTSAITSRFGELAPGAQQRLAAQSVPQALQAFDLAGQAEPATARRRNSA